MASRSTSAPNSSPSDCWPCSTNRICSRCRIEVRVTASIGIAVGDRATAGELLRDADLALYRAKGAGKNCYRLFAPEMQTAVRDRVQLENDLGDACGTRRVLLVYQPIFDLRAFGGHRRRSAAALAPSHTRSGDARRLHTGDGRNRDDRQCRPLGAATGVPSSQILARRRTPHRHVRQPLVAPARVRPLVDDVRMALATTGLDPASLILEITETAIMRDVPNTVRRLEGIKELGVRIAIDDFGTGYSSLAYLQQFPVDAIKIDRAFISGIADRAKPPHLPGRPAAGPAHDRPPPGELHPHAGARLAPCRLGPGGGVAGRHHPVFLRAAPRAPLEVLVAGRPRARAAGNTGGPPATRLAASDRGG